MGFVVILPNLSSKPKVSQNFSALHFTVQYSVCCKNPNPKTMLLQPSLHHHKVSLSSTLCYSQPIPCRNPNFTLRQSLNYRKHPIICSISKIYSYGTVDYERRPMIKWNAIYRRISLMENPELGSGSVLNQWEKEGKKLSKWELCRVVKELRKYKRYQQALEVYVNKM